MRWLSLAGVGLLAGFVGSVDAKDESPNFVVIFCDDLGYGDLGCFGHPTIKTPNLDRMAAEGQKWTQFYVAAPVCTPSRAGLMTGRYPIRNGMTSAARVVLFPNSASGLLPSEITIAEVLKKEGYSTGCVGKWHLGHLPQFLPTSQGFDSYYGIPYSNDMDRVVSNKDLPKGQSPFMQPKVEYWNVPLMRNERVIEQPADQTTITKRYTEQAQKFLVEHKEEPFFLYLAHSMPHVPLFRSKSFEDISIRGLYGDVIEEIDWSVGQVLGTLEELGLDDRTLVVFTSDNGPWQRFQTHGGSAGLLRAGKGTTYEGGMREPTIFEWKSKIEPGSVVTEMGSTLDLLATFASLSGAKVPKDRTLDSLDLSPALLGKGPSPRKDLYYWTRAELHAFRQGPWKLHLKVREPINYGRGSTLEEPLLYNLDEDPSEMFDLAKQHPEIVARLKTAMQEHAESIEPFEDQLADRIEK